MIRLLPLVVLSLSSLAAAEKLNVLFLFADDLRPDLGCCGVKRFQSPSMERLASRGMLFNRAHCRQAVCNPSRAGFLSGCRLDATRALLDRTSIELFGNHGEVTHSIDFFADPANHDISLRVEGGASRVHRLVVHELKSIWPVTP